MKKKIIGAVAVMAIAAMAAFNLDINANTNQMSTLTMDNVMALADGEVPHPCPNGCYDNGDGCYCHVWYPSYLEAG